MIDQSAEKKERWLKRLQNTRRYYFFQRLKDKPPGKKISIKQVWKWISYDIEYLFRWNINLLLQLKHFGSEVKKYSGLSFFGQWKRMAYLVFIIHKDSVNFRSHYLFDEDMWEKASKLSYARHYLIQLKFEGFFADQEIEIIVNKYAFYQYCKKHAWYTPKIHAIIINNEINYLNKTASLLPKEDLFVKELRGSQGRGIEYFTFKNGKYYSSEYVDFNSEDLIAYLKKRSKNSNGLIIQEVIKNHKEWRKFTNGSLATCRIVTGRSPEDHNEIIPFFASLRMPVGSAVGDNYSLGGIASAINIRDGKLGRAFSKKPIDGNFAWDYHPDTGALITGAHVHQWNELIEFAQTIHHKFETLSMGWDISLTEDGFCVIEGNRLWGSDVIEGPSRVPIYDTIYPEWTEAWIEKLSNH